MRVLPTLLIVMALAAPGHAGGLPRAEADAVGLDPARLADIDARVERLLEKKEFPGAIVAVARHGKVAYLNSFGEVEKDSLIRIYSMSKPITVAAALVLVDEGKLRLDDPVSRFIPGFDRLRVEGSDEPPPVMTVQHLMQHTSGLTYGIFGNSEVDKRYRAENVLGRDNTLEVMAKKLASIPLLFEPGARWHYSVSVDLLGRVIEVVERKPFDELLRQRLFEPLGMVDTGFFVPDEEADRFVPCCRAGSGVIEAPESSPFRKKPALLSGGGGLISTVDDYMRFLLMLDAGGVWKGKRILKRETVERMTTNLLPKELVPIRFGRLPLPGMGFGLGVSVRVQGIGKETRRGTWGWGGAASTTFFVSPGDRLVVITMIQRMPMWNGLDRAVRSVVFDALREPVPVEGD